MAPFNGFKEAIDVCIFILLLGGFLGVVTKTGALDAGVGALVKKLKGKETDMREGIAELSEAWENELNTVYSLLMEKLPKAEKVKLENEQKKWLKNRDIKAKKDAKEAEGGTMEPLLFTSSML